MYKEIVIENKSFNALLDTDSHLSWLREDVFKTINAVTGIGLLTDIAQGQS